MFEGLFQPMHLLVIFGIALLVFGPKKLVGQFEKGLDFGDAVSLPQPPGPVHALSRIGRHDPIRRHPDGGAPGR
jgi:hypothetical protein